MEVLKDSFRNIISENLLLSVVVKRKKVFQQFLFSNIYRLRYLKNAVCICSRKRILLEEVWRLGYNKNKHTKKKMKQEYKDKKLR